MTAKLLDVSKSDGMLIQLHNIKGGRDLIAQNDLEAYDEVRCWLRDLKQEDLITEDMELELVLEGSEHFMLMPLQD